MQHGLQSTLYYANMLPVYHKRYFYTKVRRPAIDSRDVLDWIDTVVGPCQSVAAPVDVVSVKTTTTSSSTETSQTQLTETDPPGLDYWEESTDHKNHLKLGYFLLIWY